MPNPSLHDLHVSRPLTDFSVAYFQEPDVWVGDKVAPLTPVLKPFDQYFTLGRESLLLVETEVHPDADAPAFQQSTDHGIFETKCNKLKYVIGNYKLTAQDQGLDIKRTHLKGTLECLRRRHEYWVAATCVGALSSFPGVTLAGANRWDVAGSDPIGDINTAKASVFLGCQKHANTLIIPFNVAQTLAAHAQIAGRIISLPQLGGFTSTVPMDKLGDAFAAVFGIQNCYIAGGQFIDVPLNQVPTAAANFVWGTNCWVGYSDPVPSLESNCAMKTFVWDESGGRQAEPIVRDNYDDINARAVVEARWWYVPQVVNTGAGYYLNTAIS